MEQTRNLCAQVPVSLHMRVREEQEKSGQSLSAYITQLLTDYYEKGEKSMEFTKTLACQISETLSKLSQKDFVVGLIERELEAAEPKEEDGHADME